MFEKLIASDAEGVGQSRRSYFVTSSIVVGIVFITAVVLSIYAGDYGLGEFDLELSQLSAPVETVRVEPEREPIRQQASAARAETVTQKTIRTPNVVESVELPTKIPNGISTEPNNAPTAPKGSFEIGKLNLDAGTPIGSGRPGGTGDGIGEVTPVKVETEEVKTNPIPEPPPLVPKPRPAVVRSKGVINGQATHLPTPPYPQMARVAGAGGLVKVQVTLGESGKVVAANAVEGHVLLRRGAEQAARNARFTPTMLGDTAVKVTGVIIYNFTK